VQVSEPGNDLSTEIAAIPDQHQASDKISENHRNPTDYEFKSENRRI
jgi:hypothetical protein